MDYFNKYLETKISFAMFIGQFYNTYISIDEAKKYNLEIIDDDKLIDSIRVYYHFYTTQGQYLWDSLGIEKPIINRNELWNIRKNIKNESYDENIDYKRLYLKNLLTISHLVRKFYKQDLSIEDAKRNNIEYNDFDEIDGKVKTYHHIFESAGENAWNILGIEEDIITDSFLYNYDKKIEEQLLEMDLKEVKNENTKTKTFKKL